MTYRNPIEEYANAHPECTLLEYLASEKAKARKQYEEDCERDKLRDEYQVSLVGKCFKMDFNGSSISYFRLSSIANSIVKTRIYNTYSSRESPYSMQIEEQGSVNLLWLPNPYRAKSYGEKLAVEIEEAEFLRIVKLFEEFQNIFKQIRNIN